MRSYDKYQLKTQNQKIVIPCTKSLDFIMIKDIIRCEGMQNYTRIYLLDGSILISNATIGIFKKSLIDFDFFCCHKSHVINVQHIQRYNKDGYVEMCDTSTVPVSRRNKEAFFSDIIARYNISTVQENSMPKKFFRDRLSIENKIASNDA